ncbi:MAG: VWA domain-containing protein [Spirochaetales bacterium]|nr:VWA domain-containing protein [Spirochaetales bacterium]
MLTFEEPAFLMLIAFFPLLLYFVYLRKDRGGGIPYSFKVWKGRNIIYTPLSLQIFYVVTEVFLWFALLAFVFALAGPSSAVNKKIFVERGMDIIIVLDQSPSMAARDFGAEDRLTTAREMVKEFVEGRENDSIGLVTFSEEAFLRLPPTVDHSLLIDSLDDITLIDRGDGTAIGMGVALAVLHLSSSTAAQKAILLITDGENNLGEIQPETAASMAVQSNIRIYSVGLGTTGEVPIEFHDRDTGKILSGTMKSTFDGSLLEKMAEISGGRYFYARSSGSLETIFQTINTMESYEVKTKVSVEKSYYYQGFMLAGLILFLLHWLFRRILLGELL